MSLKMSTSTQYLRTQYYKMEKQVNKKSQFGKTTQYGIPEWQTFKQGSASLANKKRGIDFCQIFAKPVI